MPPEYLLEVAKATIRATAYCFLITLGDTGQAHARLMQPFAPEEDLTIWFGTSRHWFRLMSCTDEQYCWP